ncbi:MULTISPECIES: putative colanic acid biosynthesis acetyltransferase [Algibacter]|uniref:putative colanic acid biosynthesis acetyltransferase n=1 Tax=Algibacter TaxID=261827 RepID=UPI0008EF27B7|nr:MULTISPECIES: putative colanic acid biosynthesis acetyltransferase [Algibacter]SFD29858.1 putative colanic acid biosynthesis acetyltransferase WcaF [Algibacter lectus]
MNKVDLSEYKNNFSRKNQIARLLWSVVWLLFARPLPRRLGNGWKLFLLRLFGAKVHAKAVVYSSVRIYMPWNLEMHEYSCLAPEVDCYNVDKITIGAHATVSQKTYLCAASHDINKKDYPLITAPITVKDQAWIGAAVFIGMGVTIGEGAVVGATASVFKDVEPWTIVGGNPAKFIKKRNID